MKAFNLLILILLIPFLVKSQSDSAKSDDQIKTIFGKAQSHGGFGGASYRYAIINNNHAFLNGGRGGWIINHWFALGGGGYGFATQSEFDVYKNDSYLLKGGYGGLLLELSVFPKLPAHFTFPVLIGAGGLSYTSKDSNDNAYNEDTKAFFVVEPGVEFELNLLRFFRIGFGAYYRFTNPVTLNYSDGSEITKINQMALTDMSFGVSLKFGKF